MKDEWTPKQKAILREHLTAQQLELPSMYFALPEDYQDPRDPMIPKRRFLVRYYVNLSEIDPWFNKELVGLLEECKRRFEPVPDELKHWALRFAQNSTLPAKRGRTLETNRDLKILVFTDLMRLDGHKLKDIVALLAEVLYMEESSVLKAIQRAREIQNQCKFVIRPLQE